MSYETNNAESQKKFRLPPLAFVVCLILSVIAWFFTNFSQNMEQTFEYKLVWSNLPEGKKTCTLSDTTILLTFNARGVDYLMQSCYAKDNRVIDLPIANVIDNKIKRSAYSFSNKELSEFLREQGYTDLKSVQKPEVLTIYIR